ASDICRTPTLMNACGLELNHFCHQTPFLTLFLALHLHTQQASDIRLTPTLMNACGLELNHFCRGVHPATGLAFRCLQMSINEVGIAVRGGCGLALQGRG
ncbi:unnamed protein product, partial [Closterium sp. NIES-54]